MSQNTRTGEIHRYYVCATEQELYGSGVDFATSVEFDHVNHLFTVHEFYRTSPEWIVNEPAAWAEKFAKTHPNIRIVELFKEDVIRNEEWTVYVTLECSRRIFTLEMQQSADDIMLNITHGIKLHSNN